MLAVFWIMVSTVFLSLFTANATAILSISQAEEDHTLTLGKKVIFVLLLKISKESEYGVLNSFVTPQIGVLNSKHFVEVELNTGSSVIGIWYICTLGCSKLAS